MQNVKHELKKISRFEDIEFVPDNEAVILFEKTIKLLVKPLQQVQEFLCFPQKMPDIRPLGEICLLAEDLLDPFCEYMLEFHQDGLEPISIVSDMLTGRVFDLTFEKFQIKKAPLSQHNHSQYPYQTSYNLEK